MPDAIISQILDFGALGIFAGFLIWQHLGMQKRLDQLVTGFQDQLKEIDLAFEKRVEIMRGRYDLVIDNIRKDCAEEVRLLREQKDKVHNDISHSVKELGPKIDIALNKLEEGLSEMREHFTEVRITEATKKTKSPE